MGYHSPKKVEEQLEIKTATLRKYATRLEAAGYEFEKNEHGHRFYRDIDVLALRKLIEIKTKTNMVLEECADKVMLWKNGEDELAGEEVAQPRIHPATDGQVINEERLPALQEGIIHGLVQKLEQYEAIMREQSEMIRQSMEMQKESLAIQKESHEIQTQQRITLGLQEKRIEDLLKLVEHGADMDEMNYNQLIALRKEKNEPVVEPVQEEIKPKEKNRSFWQRLFSPSN